MRAQIASFTSLVVFLAIGLVASCSSGSSAAPPTSGIYEVSFPSTAAAVGAQTVQAFVFANPSAANKTDCANLIVARQSGAGLPTPEAQTGQIPICTVLATPAQGQIPNVPYGEVSVLVVTQRSGVDYFTGCVLTTLAEGSAPISVQLEQAVATAHIPSTNCGSVSAFCSATPTCCVGCDGG
jgi:hypothetical protein